MSDFDGFPSGRGTRPGVVLIALIVLAVATTTACSDDPSQDTGAAADVVDDRGGDIVEDAADAGDDADDVSADGPEDRGGDGAGDGGQLDGSDDGAGDVHADADVEHDAPDGDEPDRGQGDVDEPDGDGPDGSDSGDASGEVTILSHSEIESPNNVLAAYVEWESDSPATGSLTVTCDGEPIAELLGEESTTSHRAFVMGLIPGATCEMRLGAHVGWFGDEVVVEYEVSDVPSDFPSFELLLPAEDASESDWDRVAPGWTLFNLTRVSSTAPLIVAMVDERGRYRWYNRRATGAGADTDVRTVPEGVLIGGALGAGGRVFPAIVNWEGDVVWEDTLATHHHMGVDPSTGELLYLSQTRACPDDVRADTVNRYSRETREVTWTWSACEHYTPPVVFNDWTHINTIDPFPGGGAYLLSVRNQHALFKIDTETGDVIWRLGWNGDFAMADEDAFWMQHSPEIQADGTILLFDNGIDNHGQPFAYDLETRGWSRVVQLAYDEEEMTAEVIWEYRPEEDVFSNIQGDADRQPNGNVLTVFTAWTFARGTDYIEVDASADEVWWLRGTNGWASYRAERVADPPRGYFIQSTDDAE